VSSIFPDLSIDTNDNHIQDHIESGHISQNGLNGPNGRHGMVKYGQKYSSKWCKDQEKCWAPMGGDLKKLKQFKSYDQIKSTLKLKPFFFVFRPKFSMSLKCPLKCLELTECFCSLLDHKLMGLVCCLKILSAC